MVLRARDLALEELHGDASRDIARLRPLLASLMAHDPDNTYHVDTEDFLMDPEDPDSAAQRLLRVFWAPAMSHRAAASGEIEPIIALDGTHCWSLHGGILFNMVGLDSSNHVIPLAHMWAQVENTENWTAFCQYALEKFGDFVNVGNAAIFSDREKGIAAAVKDAFPAAFHFHCTWHLSQNVRKRFGALGVEWFNRIRNSPTQGIYWELSTSANWNKLEVLACTPTCFRSPLLVGSLPFAPLMFARTGVVPPPSWSLTTTLLRQRGACLFSG